MHKNSHSRTHKKKNSILSLIKTLLLTLVIVMAAGSAIASYYLKRPSEFWEQFIPIPEGEKISVSVENGMTARTSCKSFRDSGSTH